LARALIGLAAGEPPLGVVHLVGAGACSWYELAREVVDAAGLRCEIMPGRTGDLGRPAPRPAYSVLGTERADAVPRLPSWREGLADYMSMQVRTA
jgi:dTDP-4-dehydrorhamnose reductase